MTDNLKQAILEGLKACDSTFEFLPDYVKASRSERIEVSVKKFIAEKFLSAIESSENDGEIALIKARHAIIGDI